MFLTYLTHQQTKKLPDRLVEEVPVYVKCNIRSVFFIQNHSPNEMLRKKESRDHFNLCLPASVM